ncbi:MAG: glycosyltransferase family 2 protein [Ignavibacteria bacterium]
MISIIIINYKQKHFISQCVASIYKHFNSYPFEVIIINNSVEENLYSLETSYPDLSVFENHNKGFSQANNLGVSYSKGDFIFFLNADTIVRSDFLKDFIDRFKNKTFGAVGLKLRNEDETFQLSFWKENTFINEITNKKSEKEFKEKNKIFIKKIENEFNNIAEADWVSGAAMIMRKQVFLDIGGFDENFFLYYEDADICKRLQLKNLKIYFYPFCSLIHFKGENVNKDFRDKASFYSKQSQLLYYKKHNKFADNLLLKSYLLGKFSIISMLTSGELNFKILRMVIKS